MARLYLERVKYIGLFLDDRDGDYHAAVDDRDGEVGAACGRRDMPLYPTHGHVTAAVISRRHFCEACESDLATTAPLPRVLADEPQWRPSDG